MRFLFIRHGESTWNADGRWQGQADPPLTDLGREQARVAAERLREIAPSTMVCSDLERARTTAQVLADELGLAAPLLEKQLRERNAGEWTGLTKEQIKEQWPGYLGFDKWPPEWESDEALFERVVAGLVRVSERQDPDGVAIVSHGGVFRLLEERATGGAAPAIPNLAARWFLLDIEQGVVQPEGDRVVLLPENQETEPWRI